MRNFMVVSSALGLTSLAANFALSYGHANAFGGSTTHSWEATGHGNSAGAGTSHKNAYRPSGSAHAYGYHPPTTVGYYGAGCYNCGGNPVGPAVTDTAVGAALGTVVANVYSPGYGAGASNEGIAPALGYAIGVNMAALPEGCVTAVVHGGTYYLCGNSWFSPFYGASGVYYQVVPTP